MGASVWVKLELLYMLPLGSRVAHRSAIMFNGCAVKPLVARAGDKYVVYVKHGGGFGRPLPTEFSVDVDGSTSFVANDCAKWLRLPSRSFDDTVLRIT